MEAVGWREYCEALGDVFVNSGRRLRVVFRTATIWAVWPLHALLCFGALHQQPGRAFWWVIPESFPFRSVTHFTKRLTSNFIDAPQVILDWIKASPFEAGAIPLAILGIVIVAAYLEVLWLSALMGNPLRPAAARSFQAAWQWLLLRGLLAVIFLPMAVAPILVVGRAFLLAQGGAGQSPAWAALMMCAGLAAGLWAMALLFCWRLLNQWLQQLWLPLRLLVSGSFGESWRYAKKLARGHWRGLVVFTVAEWAILTFVGVGIMVATMVIGFVVGDRTLLRDGLLALLLLPLWSWLRLLGPAAIGRLHESFAATPELAPPSPPTPPPVPRTDD